MERYQLSERQMTTILAALRLFQREAARFNMAEMFPEHFDDGALTPLSAAEIDQLCETMNAAPDTESADVAWSLLTTNLKAGDETPLARLTLHLSYAVEEGDLTPEQAFDVLQGEKGWLFEIQRPEDRAEALKAFADLETLRQPEHRDPIARPGSGDALLQTEYVTRAFVRADCGIHGARLSDEDCDAIITEVRRLAGQGQFQHAGVYWIANRLVAQGRIDPFLPQ